MEKGSAPPMEQAQYQQGMPEMPPSYEQSTGGPGGFVAPPPQGGYPPQGPPQGYPPQQMGAQPPQGYPSQQQKMGPPPPANYGQPVPQGMPPQAQQVVVQYVQAPSFGHRPVTMTCPHCQNHVTTSIESEPSAMAWIVGAVLCVMGLWCFSCIPCCIDSMQSVTHKCPSCKNFLGRYKGSGF